MDPSVKAVEACLSKDRFAASCGIRLCEVGAGYAKAEMAVTRDHYNGLGIVQGGAIFTLADFAFAAASNSHGTAAVGINASISFMKAIKAGLLRAEAKEQSHNHRLGTYLVEVKDEAGDLVASFQGMVYRKPGPLPA